MFGRLAKARPVRQRPRAVIYSGSCALRGVVGGEWRGQAGGGARGPPPAGQTTPLGRGGPQVNRQRRSPPPRAQPRPEEASALPARVLSFFPPPPPPTASKRKGVGAESHPSGWRECARPRRPRPACGGRGQEQPGLQEAAACVVLFLDSFQLLGKKNICLKVQKKGWGKGVEKNSKAQSGTLVYQSRLMFS